LQLSAIYCGKHSRAPKEVFHKICHIMKADQNPAQNNSLDTASNGKNALAPLMGVRNKVKQLVILVHTKRFYQFAENRLILQKKVVSKMTSILI